LERDRRVDEERARQPAEPAVERAHRAFRAIALVAAGVDLLGQYPAEALRDRFAEAVDAAACRVVGADAADEIRLVATTASRRGRARDQRPRELARAPEVVADDGRADRAGQVDVDMRDAVAAAHAADRVGIGGAADDQ